VVDESAAARTARRAPALVGRDAEQAQLDSFLDACRDGARALAIHGEPGIGKTALWRYGVAAARGSGYLLLSTRPAEEEMPLALAGLVDLFEDHDLAGAALAADTGQLARGRAVLDTLRGLAAEAPVVLAIDDLQWLDITSARTLRYEPELADAVEALAFAGQLDEAGDLLDRLRRQADAVGSPWPSAVAARARGALLLAQGDPAAAAILLHDAAVALERLGFRPDAARARLLEGRAILRDGRRSNAAEVLAAARDGFAAIGAPMWEARAVEELERVSPGRASGDLTPTEGRIAALVAEGLKNREIAERLFLSVATVEAHPTRIYRKLGIRSRSDLTRLVVDDELSFPAEPSQTTDSLS
jgi:DNA-binding CsgD family transcriptional regulator